MFDVFCPHCDSLRLIFPGRVTGIDNDDDGIVVRFTCWCGHEGALRTGRTAGRERVRWEAPALAG